MSSRAAGIKYSFSTMLGLDVKNGDDIWIVMGKTSSWTDEDVPDVPAPGDDTLVEPFLAIRPIVTSMAKSVSAEAYALLGENDRAAVSIQGVPVYLELVDDVDAYDEGARYLYIKSLYDPVIAGHPAFTNFRTYYAVIGLTPSAGYETDLWLEPAHIDDYGQTIYENAGTAVTGGYSISLPVLLEFR